jgi:S1-C subfamily serine protease
MALRAALGSRRASFQYCILHFAFCVLTWFSIALVAVPATAQSPHGTSTPAPPTDPGLSFVVQLISVGPAEKEQNRECAATGFLIDEEGYLITNAHVVEDARRCLEKAPGAKILARLTSNGSRTAQAVPCDLIGIDAPNDLALLKTERPLLRNPGDKPPYALLDGRAVPVGTAVMVTGYPAFSWQPVTQAGHVTWRGRTRLAETDDPLPNPSDALMMDIHLRPGNSGSPVVRSGGGVIGVIDKRDSLRPAYSIAVAIHYALELADRYGARWYGID